MTVDSRFDHSELTDTLIGLVFRVYNQTGFGLQEKYYQRAYALELEAAKISFVREQSLPIRYAGRIIGRYFVDFIADEKVVIELKVANEVLEAHVNQVLGYLKASGLKVGLLFVITKRRVIVKRIVNGASA